MNYKKRDDELIKLNKQAKAKVDLGDTSWGKGYSKQALDELKAGTYGSTRENKLPELKANKPSTRYNNQTAGKTETKSTRGTKYDKDFDEFHKYRLGDYSGAMDYDKATDTSTEHWRSVKENIKRKNKWSDEEFESRWNAYNDERNKKAANAEIQTAVNTAKKSGALGTLNQLLYTPQTWIEGGASMLSNLLPEKYKAQSADDTLFTGTRAKEAIKQTVKDEHINTDFGKGAYDIGTSVADMALASGVPVLGTATLGAETAARTNMNALERGVSANRAAATAGLTGLVSGALNKIGLDKALNAPAKSAIGKVGQAALIEGLENTTEDILTNAADQFINKDKSQFKTLYNYYVSQGLSDEEAYKQARNDTLKDLATSFGSGAAFGGLMSGVSNIPSLVGLKGEQNSEPIPEIDNAIKQTAEAQAKIQELSEQIPKNVTPQEAVNLQAELEAEGYGKNAFTNPEEPKVTNAVNEKTVNESTPKNPTLTEKWEGEKLESAKTERTSIKKKRDAIKTELDLLNDRVKNTKRPKKADVDRINALKKEDKELANRYTVLGRGISGKPTPIEEVIKTDNPDIHKAIYDKKNGIFADINYAVKYAGDSDEAKQLGADIRAAYREYLNTGEFEAVWKVTDKVNRLNELAQTVNKEYAGGDFNKHFGNYDDATDTFKDASLWNALQNKKIYKYIQDIWGTTKAVKTEPTPKKVPELKPTPIDNGNVPPMNNTGVPETTPANGEEKIRSFSRRGSEDTSLPDEVRNDLKADTYSVVRNADTEARADSLFNGDDLTQTRSNLEQAVKNLDPAAAPLSYKLAKAYIDAGQYDAATDVIELASAGLTRGGQFTQAAKLAMMQYDPMAAMRAYKRDLDNVNKWGKDKYGKKWNKLELSKEDMDLFSGVAKGDKDALNGVVDQLNSKFGKQVPASLWDKAVAGSKTAMLLNMRTQGRNIISNMAMLPIRSTSDRVSALGQNIAHLINPDTKVTQSITGGTKDQKDIAGQIFDSMKADILGENKMKDSTKSSILSNRQIFNDDIIGRFIDSKTNGGLQRLNERLGGNANKSTMETLSNFTYWLMGDFGDTPFVKKNFVNRLASYMKAQGINSIDDVPDDAIALATEEALKATFKDDNAFSNALSGIKKKSGKFGEIALPFVKTPANLAMRGIDYSPAGLVNTFRKIKSGAEASKVIDELSKNLTGTAMIYLGYKLREKGLLSGNYSEDKDEKAWQKQQGMLENAVHIGDNYYTFDWAQPSSTPLILGSVIFDAINNSDNENSDIMNAVNSAYKGALAVGNSWINTSPVQSLADMLGGDGYSDDGGIAGNILNEVIEFPQRFIPAQMGAAARTIDPVIRDTYTNDNTLTGILGNQLRSIQAKIPQLSKNLPASYDTWGNERTRSDTKGEAFFAQNINPGQLGNKNETPLDAEITRLYEATGNKEVFPLSAARSLNLGNDGNIKLTNIQHSDYQKMLGQRSYEFAENLMNNKDFAALSDEEKVKTLKKAYDLSNALAKEELFDHAIDDSDKLANAYKTGGTKGAVEYLINKSKADKYGMTVDNYLKAEAEYKGGAAQKAKDDAVIKSINEQYGTNFNTKSFEKYGEQGLVQRAQDSNSAVEYGFVDKNGNAQTDSYEKAVSVFGNDVPVLQAYSEFHKQGYTKNSQIIPALKDNNSFTAEQKGKVVMAEHGYKYDDLGKAAKGAYDIGGEAGVWYYYMLKNMADSNGNGSLDKKEKAGLRQLMESDSPYVTQIPDDIYYYLGNSKNW